LEKNTAGKQHDIVQQLLWTIANVFWQMISITSIV